MISGITNADLPTTSTLPVEQDVTTIVRNWANGVWANNGFNLRDGKWVFPSDTLYRDTQFESMDHYFNLNHRPKLIVEFE